MINDNIFANFKFIKMIIMKINPEITIGTTKMLKNKFEIKKYGLNVFIFSKIIGNINNCTDKEIDIISFNLSNVFCICGLILQV